MEVETRESSKSESERETERHRDREGCTFWVSEWSGWRIRLLWKSLSPMGFTADCHRPCQAALFFDSGALSGHRKGLESLTRWRRTKALLGLKE